MSWFRIAKLVRLGLTDIPIGSVTQVRVALFPWGGIARVSIGLLPTTDVVGSVMLPGPVIISIHAELL